MNKKIAKGILRIAMFLGVFLLIQMVLMLIIAVCSLVIQGVSMGDIVGRIAQGQLPYDGKTQSVTYALIGLFTALLFIREGWAPVSRTYLQSRPWAAMAWVLILAVGTLIPSAYLEELAPVEMPNDIAQLFAEMLSEPIGYVALGVLVPLAEELVFRGAILRTLLGLTPQRHHWVAIAISAVLFGAVHLNWAQMLHAIPMGLLLGWLYYRTSSVVPGVIFHCVNNSAVYVVTNLITHSPNARLTDIFGSQPHVLMAVGFSLCLFIPALFQLALRLKKAA